jgi:hypothetical protein
MAVVRIFYEKLQEVIEDVMKRHCFGRVKSFVYSVEHQKRGMPHIHMVITLDEVGCLGFFALLLEPLIQVLHLQDAPLPEGSAPFGSSGFVDNIITATIPSAPDEKDNSVAAQQQRRIRQQFLDFQLHNCNGESLSANALFPTLC